MTRLLRKAWAYFYFFRQGVFQPEVYRRQREAEDKLLIMIAERLPKN